MQAGYRYAVITRYISGSSQFRTQFGGYRGDVPRGDHPYGRSLRRWGTVPLRSRPETGLVIAGCLLSAG